MMLLGITCCVQLDVKAQEKKNFINESGVKIEELKYQNLLNLGFTEDQIQFMSQEEYDRNKDLIGEIVSEKIVYLKNDNGQDREISEEEYNQLDSILLLGMQAGYIETGAKKMTTTIVSTNGRYRYKVDLDWKSMPSVRSYDIIGIGIDSNVKLFLDPYFKQNFCYSLTECSSSTVHSYKNTSTGGSAAFKLPSSKVVKLASYLYFDVVKNTSATITSQNAYGDYAHATKSISEANSRNYNITKSGITFNGISSYYDEIPCATAKWTSSW